MQNLEVQREFFLCKIRQELVERVAGLMACHQGRHVGILYLTSEAMIREVS